MWSLTRCECVCFHSFNWAQCMSAFGEVHCSHTERNACSRIVEKCSLYKQWHWWWCCCCCCLVRLYIIQNSQWFAIRRLVIRSMCVCMWLNKRFLGLFNYIIYASFTSNFFRFICATFITFSFAYLLYSFWWFLVTVCFFSSLSLSLSIFCSVDII